LKEGAKGIDFFLQVLGALGVPYRYGGRLAPNKK